MKKIIYILIVLVLIVFIFGGVFFQIDEREQGVVLQFGKPVTTVKSPGIHMKLPFPIQNLVMFEDRILDYDAAPTEVVTKDKKNLVIDNFAKWRIVEPLLFLQTVRDENGAQARLDDIIYSELRVEVGKHELSEIVSTSRENIMENVSKTSDAKSREYGIEIIDVRIKRTDLPEENEKAVFNRMRAERTRIAKKYRSEGEEEALKIRAETDKEKTIILAEAYKTSQTIRGEGESLALKIYADAYKQDPGFFEFFRTLEAYRNTIDSNTTIVLSQDDQFLKFLNKK